MSLALHTQSRQNQGTRPECLNIVAAGASTTLCAFISSDSSDSSTLSRKAHSSNQPRKQYNPKQGKHACPGIELV
ncbi:hypothetical protein VTJ04DRAFT_5984 [Mycothermus thermophilus]|uniref:uncharacterized protein n=1 Tax=Humicola insolens TaxID=85995 RepID=UPI003742659D